MTFRRTIRNTPPEPTPAEAILWESLRGRKLGGLKFRRQHPINAYILDFWCSECRLVIELDGGIHNSVSTREHAAARQAHLEGHGYTVLRFRNEEIQNELPQVLNVIRATATPF